MRKKLLLLTAIITYFTPQLSSQCKEEETISTNPNNPINTELEKIISAGGINEFLNTFDWGKRAGTTNVIYYPIQLNPKAGWMHNGQTIPANAPPSTWTMQPLFSINNLNDYGHLVNNAISPNDYDFRWEDGWELMWLHTGYYPYNFEDISTINESRIIISKSDLNNNSTPYIALYNRYTGKIRFWGNYFFNFSLANPKFLNLRLFYNKQSNVDVSGIFRHANSYDQALDKETENIGLSALNHFPNDNSSWFISEFQLGYDPCVCHYKSHIIRNMNLLNDFELNLSSQTFTHRKAPLEVTEKYFLYTLAWSQLGNRNGSIIFKSMQGLNNYYISELNEYQKQLANYNKIKNKVTSELIELSSTVYTKGSIETSEVSTQAKEFIVAYMKKIDPLFDESNSINIARGIRKVSDALLANGMDFISKHYISQESPLKPFKFTLPTAVFPETNISGALQITNTRSLGISYTPGSLNINNPLFVKDNLASLNYPIYNKPTGLYALLKTPKIAFGNHVNNGTFKKYATLTYHSSEWKTLSSANNTIVEERVVEKKTSAAHSILQDISFHLNDKLYYKLNRNLDINDDKSNVLVSFQIELEANLPPFFHSSNVVIGEKRLDIDLSKTNFEILSHEPYVNESQKEKITLEIPWLKMDSTFQKAYGGQISLTSHYNWLTDNYTEVRTQTLDPMNPDLVKKTATSKYNSVRKVNTNVVNLVYKHVWSGRTVKISNKKQNLPWLFRSMYKFDHHEFLSTNNDIAVNIKSIKMKVLTDLTFHQVSSKGGEVNTTQVFTYLLFDKDKNIDLIGDYGKWMNTAEIENIRNRLNVPDSILLQNVTINPQSPFVSSVNGNDIWIKAREIIIGENIVVQQGYKVQLLVFNNSNNVKLLNSDTLPQNFEIKTFQNNFTLFPWNDLTTETSPQEVNDFCSGPSREYNAHIASKAALSAEKDDTNNQHDKHDDNNNPLNNLNTTQSHIYPNPTKDVFYLTFDKEIDTDIALSITDISGKVVQNQILAKGTNTFQINASPLSNGIYFVTITQNGHKTTHKMMVHKE